MCCKRRTSLKKKQSETKSWWMFYFLLGAPSLRLPLPRQGGPQKPGDPRAVGREFPGAGIAGDPSAWWPVTFCLPPHRAGTCRRRGIASCDCPGDGLAHGFRFQALSREADKSWISAMWKEEPWGGLFGRDKCATLRALRPKRHSMSWVASHHFWTGHWQVK